MKRSKPISAAPWKTKAKPTAKPDPVTAEVRALVRARARGTCELCGAAAGVHHHHRQLRRFGDHSPVNIVLLCNADHTRVHGHPSWSYETGWLVLSTDDPATVPVAIHGVRWCHLLPDGSYRMGDAA